jgi:hypothetical protein
MKFLSRRIVLSLSVILLSLGFVTAASAASIPTLGTRLYYMLGSFLKGGMVAGPSVTLDTTAVAGYWDVLPEFNSSSTLMPVTNSITSGYAYKGTFNVYVRGTGSTTLRYGAFCFRNPLAKISGGSGSVVTAEYHNKYSPAGVGGDIGFVKSCTGHAANDNTASGDTLINNTCTSSGCISKFASGSGLNFNNADYIKFTPRGNLTSSFQARFTFTLLNDWGR